MDDLEETTKFTTTSFRAPAWLALLLLVPAPSLGVVFGMRLFPDSAVGRVIFLLSKVWLFTFPVLWLRFVERKRFSLSPPRNGGFGAGIVSGLLISVAIIGLYIPFGDKFIDKAFFIEKLTDIGLGSLPVYLGGMACWVLVNSVLEEYVWRWFCVEQCEKIWSKPVAIAASALFFTLHHILAMAVYFPTVTVALCATGVCIGGVIWSAMYVRYRSIWTCYVSHAIVDIAVFGIGAALLFGQAPAPQSL